LRLQHDEQLSNFAFIFNLRRYSSGAATQMVSHGKYMKEMTRQRDIVRRLSGGGQSGRATAAAKELTR